MSSASDKKSTKTKSFEKDVKGSDHANPDFETLNFTYGKASNIVKFKETAFNYCLKQLGQVSRVIRDTKRYIPPAIPDPQGNNPFSAANDPFGAKKAAYLRQVSNFEDAIHELQSKEPQLFAHLWGNMSKESRSQVEKIQQHKMDYEGNLMYVDAAGDPVALGADGAVPAGAVKVMEVWEHIFGQDVLSLIRRINTTHLTPDTGVIEVNQEQTKIRYESLKQFPQESVLDYKRRFNNALDAMTAVGLKDIPGPSQAARFIINLDNSRYGAYKADVTNWAKNGIMAYPQTLEAAFESASTYREAHTVPSALTGSAYSTIDRGTSRGRGRGKGRGRGHFEKLSVAESTESDPKCTNPVPYVQKCIGSDIVL
jgi:hypothetical protein